MSGGDDVFSIDSFADEKPINSPRSVEAMLRLGIDLPELYPKSVLCRCVCECMYV